MGWGSTANRSEDSRGYGPALPAKGAHYPGARRLSTKRFMSTTKEKHMSSANEETLRIGVSVVDDEWSIRDLLTKTLNAPATCIASAHMQPQRRPYGRFAHSGRR
jgi:hypothetical protein